MFNEMTKGVLGGKSWKNAKIEKNHDLIIDWLFKMEELKYSSSIFH